MVEANASVKIAGESMCSRAENGDSVSRSGGVFEIGAEECSDTVCALYASGLDQSFESEGMRVATGGEKAVGELEQAEERISGHR
jgi:hypothetical protein